MEWGRPLYFCPVVSSSSFYLHFSSPILSRRRLDVYHTSTHDVALVRISGLKHAARGSLKIQDAKNRQLECGPMPNVMAAQPNIGGTLCESSVIRRKVWLTSAAGVPCSNAANAGERKTWT